MKTPGFFLSFAVWGFLLISAATFGQKAKSVYYYPVKSAYVEYVYSGPTTGTEYFYMEQNGKLMARFSELTTKTLGTTSKTNQIVIQKDSIIYTIDMIKKTGVKLTTHIDPKDLEKWYNTADQIYTDMGFKKTGEEVLLGKKCDIWEGMSSKVWVWQNIALKTETNMLGKYVIEAKKVETGISIDKNKFIIPSDIKMQEATFNSSDPAADSVGKDLQKGLNELKNMFGPKKKK